MLPQYDLNKPTSRLTRRLTLLAVALCLPAASALSGRGSFVFTQVAHLTHLKPRPCPGRLGNKDTRCAAGAANKTAVQSQLSRYKGWKQTDPWKAGSTGFTSTGTDQFVVTVMTPIGSKKGTLLIFSEF